MSYLCMGTLCLVLLAGALPSIAAGTAGQCVTLVMRHYYAREVHDDYLLRQMEVCLSSTSRSLQYELPPLSVPLTLEAAEGLTAVVTELESGVEVFRASGTSVTFQLPPTDLRYQLRVSVAAGADGVVVGYIDGVEVGRVLLLQHRQARQEVVTIALGGLSGEWWFQTTQPAHVSLTTISVPVTRINASRWRPVYSLRADRPTVILSDGWQAGGYLALRVRFPHQR